MRHLAMLIFLFSSIGWKNNDNESWRKLYALFNHCSFIFLKCKLKELQLFLINKLYFLEKNIDTSMFSKNFTFVFRLSSNFIHIAITLIKFSLKLCSIHYNLLWYDGDMSNVFWWESDLMTSHMTSRVAILSFSFEHSSRFTIAYRVSPPPPIQACNTCVAVLMTLPPTHWVEHCLQYALFMWSHHSDFGTEIFPIAIISYSVHRMQILHLFCALRCWTDELYLSYFVQHWY